MPMGSKSHLRKTRSTISPSFIQEEEQLSQLRMGFYIHIFGFPYMTGPPLPPTNKKARVAVRQIIVQLRLPLPFLFLTEQGKA